MYEEPAFMTFDTFSIVNNMKRVTFSLLSVAHDAIETFDFTTHQ